MKRLSVWWIIIIFALIGVGVGVGLTHYSVGLPRSTQAPAVVTPAITSTPSPAPVPAVQQSQVAEPQTLTIPKLNVQTSVEQVGQDAGGRMDVPTGVDNVGWYSLGFKPGEAGNAVIDGHLDTVTGAPAVFFYLDRLTAGDQVMVTDKNGKNLTFEVTNVQSYPFDQVPLQDIFGPNDKPRLNLITCIGVWDRINRNYSNRLVVYTELKS